MGSYYRCLAQDICSARVNPSLDSGARPRGRGTGLSAAFDAPTPVRTCPYLPRTSRRTPCGATGCCIHMDHCVVLPIFFLSRNQARGKCIRFTLVSPLAVEATTSHSNLCNHILLIWAHQDARGHVLRVWRACCMLRIVSRFCVALCLSPALL